MAYQANPTIVYMTTPQVGLDPTYIKCPHCNSEITTVVEHRASMKTHRWFLLLCAIGCVLCAPCVYLDRCMAKKHSCPNCHKFIAMYDN